MLQHSESDDHSPVNVIQFQDKNTEIESEALWDKEDTQQEYHIQINSDRILDIFQSIETQIDPFTCVFKTNQQMIVMHKQKLTLLKKLGYLICKSENKYCIILIKLENQNSLLIKSLKGDSEINDSIMKRIGNAIYQFSDKNQHLSHIDEIMQVQIYIRHEDSRFNPFHLDSLSVAMIYKYLQDKIVIPDQITMKQIYNLIEKEHENIKREPLLVKQQQVSQFHIFTIERFIFNKIYDQMMNHYIEKFQERQNQVDLKKMQLREKYSKEDLIKSLEIKNHYLPNADIPYFEAINELKLINLYKTPTEMLKQFQYVLVLIRGVAFECNQKEEIIAMDDELPILIWVALMSDITNLYAKIYFVDDYIQEIENEKRILTNLRVSLDYISKEWKL
ncbi:unnamed protein product (macronuclear) [Paramecium tetraurelia]|uniref:VPS9 domain-containing protein n=1 Tax=Paramecium tetraurelia TaxID=5888 RepID=A0DVK6_PARTE|nr:uncharacterized protein GSPATT00020726001 [Paramecium tetraurelia]CAK87073.1 unnamed protein product [Paramecium tetraurelia]|eukprot:XP_001454470.1 hypothetical protein (macronuclear) [Paramecium tetraurelia strain d4-2]